jgi:hypothetical protein
MLLPSLTLLAATGLGATSATRLCKLILDVRVACGVEVMVVS